MLRPEGGLKQKFYTFKKVALAHLRLGQKLGFLKGKGYFLFGRRWGQITMYDSIDIRQIPLDAKAVAGYVNGHWPTYNSLAKWAFADRLSIAVTASADADCLDVEQGDATVDQAAAWVKRQQARGVYRPVVYTSVSQAALLLRTLARAGISRNQIRLWTAHYTFKPHRCSSSCGFGFWGTADATQYTDHALGRNLDASLCSPSFFATPDV